MAAAQPPNHGPVDNSGHPPGFNLTQARVRELLGTIDCYVPHTLSVHEQTRYTYWNQVTLNAVNEHNTNGTIQALHDTLAKLWVLRMREHHLFKATTYEVARYADALDKLTTRTGPRVVTPADVAHARSCRHIMYCTFRAYNAYVRKLDGHAITGTDRITNTPVTTYIDTEGTERPLHMFGQRVFDAIATRFHSLLAFITDAHNFAHTHIKQTKNAKLAILALTATHSDVIEAYPHETSTIVQLCNPEYPDGPGILHRLLRDHQEGYTTYVHAYHQFHDAVRLVANWGHPSPLDSGLARVRLNALRTAANSFTHMQLRANSTASPWYSQRLPWIAPEIVDRYTKFHRNASHRVLSLREQFRTDTHLPMVVQAELRAIREAVVAWGQVYSAHYRAINLNPDGRTAQEFNAVRDALAQLDTLINTHKAMTLRHNHLLRVVADGRTVTPHVNHVQHQDIVHDQQLRARYARLTPDPNDGDTFAVYDRAWKEHVSATNALAAQLKFSPVNTVNDAIHTRANAARNAFGRASQHLAQLITNRTRAT